jgi:hypothetical protein
MDAPSQRTPTRYIKPLDENALFLDGAAPFRLDAATAHVVRGAFERAAWLAPPEGRHDTPFLPSHPVGKPKASDRQAVLDALALVLNDPILVPGLRQLGTLQPVDLEMQNGAFDGTWHHDRMVRGHAGAFFLLLYFGEPTWDPSWGGGFFYGERDLKAGWPHSIDPPPTHKVVWPQDRNAVLGWNENPRLIHKAQPLAAPRTRLTAVVPVDLVLHGTR